MYALIIEVSKRPNSKSSYAVRYRFDGPDADRQALFHYNCINIGRGYKKRLVRALNGTRKVLHRTTS
jgi:hypothetical protein